MRRRTALIALACVALSGCGSQSGDDASPASLQAWSFPRGLFIPQVDVDVPAPPPDPAAERRVAAKQVAAARRRAARRAAAPQKASEISPGAPSDAEIRAQLERLYGQDAGADSEPAPSGGSAPAAAGAGVELERVVALDRGEAIAPPDAPDAVQRIVAAANQVARLPYVYGGGHGGAEGMFVDSAYDCSGSVSFALANAGLMDRPMTSGEMMRWGAPGQGRWVTIYANDGHAFMVVGGARFDTVGLRQTGSRWQQPFRSIRGFVARHPAGL